MKRLLFGIILLFLIISIVYSQEPTQPLQLIIKSDKQVYEAGEDIVIHAGLKNLSDKVVNVNTGGYLNWNDTCRFFFQNEKGEECRLIHMGPVDILIPDQLLPKQSFDFWSYTIGLLKDKEFKWQSFKFELVKGKDYSFAGKQSIYLKDWGLTSNTITIEVAGKKAGITKEKAIEIAKEYAMRQGQNLKIYQEPTATFDETNKTWDVSFKMEPMPPGGEFDIIIDGETGKALQFFPGE